MGDPRFKTYRDETNKNIGKRSKIISNMLKDIPQLMFNETNGAFYNTIIFREETLNHKQKLKIENTAIRNLVENWVANEKQLDKRFVYYLLGAKGVCVVPISSFCSDLQGFRVTLLEEDEGLLVKVFTDIRDGVIEYLAS